MTGQAMVRRIWPLAGKSLGCMAMTEIVLRVRLIGGEHLDVTYDEAGGAPEQVVEQVISTLPKTTAYCTAGTNQRGLTR